MTAPVAQATGHVCHVCGGWDVAAFPEYTSIRRITSDCKLWPAGGELCVCRSCGCVQKVVNAAWRADEQKIYQGYRMYEQSAGADQIVVDQHTGLPTGRSAWLIDQVDCRTRLERKGRLLDFGCGNGALLRVFAARFPGWSLVGVELGGQYKTEVESIPGVEGLYTGALDGVPGRFDMITLVHAIEHVVDPCALLSQLKGRLGAEGLLLIDCPDYTQNPFDLVVADHCTHFSPDTLRNLVAAAGFDAVLVSTDILPREIVVLARPRLDASAGPSPSNSDAAAVRRSLAWLAAVREAARMVTPPGPFGIFGTGLAGTWLFGEMGSAVSLFVDEDEKKAGRDRFGLPVLRPRETPAAASVFLAFLPPQALAVQQRMIRAGCRFTMILPPRVQT